MSVGIHIILFFFPPAFFSYFYLTFPPDDFREVPQEGLGQLSLIRKEHQVSPDSFTICTRCLKRYWQCRQVASAANLECGTTTKDNKNILHDLSCTRRFFCVLLGTSLSPRCRIKNFEWSCYWFIPFSILCVCMKKDLLVCLFYKFAFVLFSLR